MIRVPTLEEQRANQQFIYEKIVLFLFSQTKFDKVMAPRSKGKTYATYDCNKLKDFVSCPEKRDQIIKEMPIFL